MYFKRLELYGFKSFVDKTTLIFESGVTAIVGPNGTGKSNISDAIKWVLGEQSAKSMRGSKMEDVIFNGTETRPPVNMAEVSLTLSNEGRHLPLDYDEVTLTRRLYRSGESEYLLNKTLVRLKDIQEMLMGTGIGTEAYSLLEQGRIDTIISSKPEDRREVFEEASGITRYKKKKNEAIRKLEQTQENLLRVNDIVAEVTRQVHSIERQVSKARRYQEQFELLKTLEMQFGYKEYVELTGQRRQIQEQQAAHRQQETVLDQNLVRLTETFERLRESLAQAEAAYSAAQELVMSLNAQIDKNTDRLQLNRERVSECTQRSGSLAAEIEQGRIRIGQWDEELRQMEERIQAFQSEKNAKQELQRRKESDLTVVEEEVRQAQHLIGEEKSRAVNLLAEHAQVRNDLAKFSANIHNFELRLQRLRQEQEKTRQEAADVTARLSNTAQEVEQLQGGVQAKEQHEVQLRGELEQLTTTLNQLEAEIQRAQQALIARQSQLGVLEQLNKTYEGFDAPVRELMRRRDQHVDMFAGVHDVLVNLIDVACGYEAGVETALADALQAVLVETRADAYRLQSFADEQGIGRVRFMIKSALSGACQNKPIPEYAEPLGAQIACAPQYRALVDHLLTDVYVLRGVNADASDAANSIPGSEREQSVRFSYRAPEQAAIAVVGDFNNWQVSDDTTLRYRAENLWEITVSLRPGRYRYKFVVNGEWVTDPQNPSLDIDAGGNLNSLQEVATQSNEHAAVPVLPAQFTAGERFVTREGKLFSAAECISKSVAAQQLGLVTQKARMRELKAECERISVVIAQYVEQEQQKRQAQIAAQEALTQITRLLNDEKIVLANRDSERTGIESEKKKIADEMRLIDVEIEETALDEQDMRAKERLGQEQLTRIDAEKQKSDEALATVNARAQDASQRRESLLVEIAEVKTQNALLDEQETGMLTNRAMRLRSRDELQTAVSDSERQREELSQRVSGLAIQIEELEQEVERLTREHQSAEKDWQQHGEQRGRILGEFETTQQDRRAQEQELNAVKNQLRDQEVRALELGFRIDALAAGMQQNYKIDLASLHLELPVEIDWNTHAQQINELKAKLDRLGAVNLAAVDEEKELRERLNFLTTQREDLVAARETLMQTIQKINRTTRSLFMETFEKSKIAFKEYFRLLFGGGDAQLHLVEGEDVLESGIDIVVRPPGKRLQSITLLSGGERTLTAIALLFALFKIKPSPFCVLDEMDAPLDESNVDRFTRVLQEFLKTSQFIIITHNKKTIAMADVMYGVTMQDPGISRLVSVKFSEYKDASPQEAVDAVMAAPAAEPEPQETVVS